MKKTNKIAAMAAAALLAGAVAIPSVMMAVSATKVSISEDSAEGRKSQAEHTYNAYPIFAGNQTAQGLTITGWGTGFNSNGLLADTGFRGLVISGTQTVGDFIGTNTDAATVAQAIEALNIENNSEKADKLAAILSKYVGGTPTELGPNATDLGAGYWIVLDSYTDAVEQDAVSKYILRVTGGTEAIAITPKKSYPSVVKKVQENTNVSDYSYTVGTTEVTDTDYNDVADYNIGDSVPFKLYGTMPSTYADYAHYYYCFTDTLASQFTMPATTGVTVKVVNPDGADEGEEADVTTLTAGTDYTVDITGQVLTVTFMDTTTVASITKDSVITVEYSAVLNSNAVIGLNGQENKVDLEYSNNPNSTGDGTTKPDDTDKTPEDKVIVFTYQQNIKKVDSATGNPLSAVFTLSRGSGEDIQYAMVAGGKVTGWTANEADASELTTDGETGLCSVAGLDDGAYTITEKTAPTGGYNAISSHMTLTINATTQNGQTWDGSAASALTAITLTVGGDTHISDDSASLSAADTATKGIVQAKITNDKGVNLPTTGGIGTKLFIIGGGTAAALAGIYLISRKRSKEEDAE